MYLLKSKIFSYLEKSLIILEILPWRFYNLSLFNTITFYRISIGRLSYVSSSKKIPFTIILDWFIQNYIPERGIWADFFFVFGNVRFDRALWLPYNSMTILDVSVWFYMPWSRKKWDSKLGILFLNRYCIRPPWTATLTVTVLLYSRQLAWKDHWECKVDTKARVMPLL